VSVETRFQNDVTVLEARMLGSMLVDVMGG
jgi:hypothetical protein